VLAAPASGVENQALDARFPPGRHVRQQGVASRARSDDRLHSAVGDERPCGRGIVEEQIDPPCQQVDIGRLRALIGDFEQVDRGEALQQHRADVLAGADSGSCDRQPARIGARKIEHLAQRVLREVLARDQGIGERADERHRREVRDRVVTRILVQAEIERHVGKAADEQRIAVGRRRRGRLRADQRSRPDAVLHDERLPELRAQLVAEQPADKIVAAAGRAGHDDPHRLRRVDLAKRAASRKQARRQQATHGRSSSVH